MAGARAVSGEIPQPQLSRGPSLLRRGTHQRHHTTRPPPPRLAEGGSGSTRPRAHSPDAPQSTALPRCLLPDCSTGAPWAELALVCMPGGTATPPRIKILLHEGEESCCGSAAPGFYLK